MRILKSILYPVVWIIGFVAGLFFYSKALDKPEQVINNKVGSIKNKGQGSSTDLVQDGQADRTENRVKQKKKFRIFRRSEKRGH